MDGVDIHIVTVAIMTSGKISSRHVWKLFSKLLGETQCMQSQKCEIFIPRLIAASC